MTGRKLYTVWYRRDFYVQIGIDWDFPGIKDRIISIVNTLFPRYPQSRAVIFETVLVNFLQLVAATLSSCEVTPMDFDDIISLLFRRHSLRLDGKDGITLCKFEIPKWPEYFDFRINEPVTHEDSFCPDNRINKDIYEY
ncbi:hypothetical protein [Snodgrassella communis]|uniref:hypothetical protein n=1 Tax=Snodgrassella communis TaxID=2946699 RepID=UPI000C1E7B53|nr:hypothetical protein [Snodgrassella communis]PIT07988.1 hypothetical protein BGI31_08360 [Snodgrassella communis]